MGNCVGGGELPAQYPGVSEVVNKPAPTGSSTDGKKTVQPAPSVKRPSSLTSSVLGRPSEDVKVFFSIGRELGRGQFGVTYLCTDKITGDQLACKSIAKRKLITKEDVEDVRREVAIMHHLNGHSNIVSLRDAYEDKHSVHIVMELCSGGELFDRIINRGHYSEKEAAQLIRTIVQVVEHCHSLGVMHRDLKPENFLLSTKKEDASLKATDFGLSVFFKPGETFTDIVGSAYYVAPEVLRRKYGPEADIWSCGVILYILLSGVPPFWADNEQGIFDAVLRGQIDFLSDPWPSISSAAKDLVKRMLKQNPKERLTASQVLNNPWVRPDGTAPDKPLDSAVLSRLKRFSNMNKMKKVALRVIASTMSEEEIAGLKEMFAAMDTDNSGAITYDELKEGLRRHGSNIPESQIRELMEAADLDNSGSIDYDEFITATIHLNKALKQEHLFVAFKHFDTDGSGFISHEELRQALSEHGNLEPGEIEDIIAEVDTDNDGSIDYNEFCTMMTKGNPAQFEQNGRASTRNFLDVTIGPPKGR